MPEIVRKQSITPDVRDSEYILSDATVDRYGDVIEPAGWDLASFVQNPIALFNHNPFYPIGTWEKIRVEKGQLKARLKIAEQGTSGEIDKVRELVRQGVLKATSVGFIGIEKEPLDKERPERRGTRYRRQELLECSLVSVPANPNALQVAKSLNLSDEMMRTVFGVSADRTSSFITRGMNGVPAETPPARRAIPVEPIAKQIEAAQERLNALRDQQTAHVAQLGEEPDETQHAITEELNRKLASAQRHLDNLQEAERQMASRAVQIAQDRKAASGDQSGRVLHGEILPPHRLFAVPAKQPTPAERAMQILVGLVCAHQSRGQRSVYEVIAERYGSDGKIDEKTKLMADIVMRREGLNAFDVVQRAATAPATTTTSGWASQLVETTQQGFTELLMPASVFPGLSSRALRLMFGRAGIISVPARAATPTVAGSFVAEGAPIPVRQAAFTSVTFTPKKMAVITAYTREIAEHSNPSLEALLRNAIQEDTSVSLDTVLLDATVASAVRPAGIRAGVAVTTATAGGGFDALVGDITNLLTAVQTGSSGNLRQLVWIMNPIQATRATLTQNAGGDFPFKAEINMGTLQGYPLVLSSTVPAGMVILMDAADFVVIEGGAPRFDLSDQTVLVFDDTAPPQIGTPGAPATVGAPARSMFQTDSIALRMIFDVNWGFVRTGTVAWTEAVTW